MSPSRVYVVCYICHPNAVTHIKRASEEGGSQGWTRVPNGEVRQRDGRNMALKKGSIITCTIYDLGKQATLVGETLIDTHRLGES